MLSSLSRSGIVASAIAVSITIFNPAAQAKSTPSSKVEFLSRAEVMEWIDKYRHKPEPHRLAAAVRVLSTSGALRDPETAGFYVGFAAGVLGANPRQTDRLMEQMLPLPAADQWFAVRALAYSGLPAWKAVLARMATKLPDRRGMIDEHLADKLPTLDTIVLDKSTTFIESLGEHFGVKPDKPEISFARNPELLDTLWGQFFANGQAKPILRVTTLLPWSKDRDSAERLHVGSLAKVTLANNAARYPDVLTMLRQMAQNSEADVKPIIAEVIRAAETSQTANLRKDQLAAMEKLKVKGAGYQRDMKLWGHATQGAIGVGCVVAAVMSFGAAGIPCVIGGAATSAAVNYWAAQ
jgi:hypothetical protein